MDNSKEDSSKKGNSKIKAYGNYIIEAVGIEVVIGCGLTFLGSLVGGSWGAVVGATGGTVLLGLSTKNTENSNDNPVTTAAKEDNKNSTGMEKTPKATDSNKKKSSNKKRI